MPKKKKGIDLNTNFDAEMVRPLNSAEKEMLQLMKEARNKNGSINWKLLERLIGEKAKSAK